MARKDPHAVPLTLQVGITMYNSGAREIQELDTAWISKNTPGLCRVSMTGCQNHGEFHKGRPFSELQRSVDPSRSPNVDNLPCI